MIISKMKNFRRSVRDWGINGTVDNRLNIVAENVFKRVLHWTKVPTLAEICAFAESVYANPDDLLKHIFKIEDNELARLRLEYGEIKSEVLKRYEDRSLPFPRLWAVEEGSAFLLYAIVRMTCPSTVLETGVANGHSTLLILNALGRNADSPALHSVDVSPKVGQLINPAERTHWHLHLLSLDALKKGFNDVVAALPSIDLMLQDSDHSYRWAELELKTALPTMAPTGILICDDANLTFAVIDFCRAHNLRPILLVDTRKVIAVVPLRKGGTA